MATVAVIWAGLPKNDPSKALASFFALLFLAWIGWSLLLIARLVFQNATLQYYPDIVAKWSR